MASTGLLDSSMAEDPAAGASSAQHGTPAGTSAAGSMDSVPQPQRAAAGEGEGTADAERLAAENERLTQQLQEALEAAGKWQGLHAQLHAFCVEQVLPGTRQTHVGT